MPSVIVPKSRKAAGYDIYTLYCYLASTILYPRHEAVGNVSAGAVGIVVSYIETAEAQPVRPRLHENRITGRRGAGNANPCLHVTWQFYMSGTGRF